MAIVFPISDGGWNPFHPRAKYLILLRRKFRQLLQEGHRGSGVLAVVGSSQVTLPEALIPVLDSPELAARVVGALPSESGT